MTYDKNFGGSGTGSTGASGTTGTTGARSGAYTSPGYGSQPYGYGSGYESYNREGDSYGESASSGAKMLVPLLLGAAVGAAVALLYAPTAGRDTRANLNRWARDARNKANDMASHMKDKFQRPGEEFGSGSNFGTGTVSNVGHNEDREIPEL